MSLDAVEQPMVDWPYGEIGLVHAECPFDKEQIAVILDNFLVFDFTVCHISLQSVHPCVFGNFALVYGDGRLTFRVSSLL